MSDILKIYVNEEASRPAPFLATFQDGEPHAYGRSPAEAIGALMIKLDESNDLTEACIRFDFDPASRIAALADPTSGPTFDPDTLAKMAYATALATELKAKQEEFAKFIGDLFNRKPTTDA